MFESIVEAVFSYAVTQPDKLCLADENRAVTYGEYKKEICSMASFLKQLGVSKAKKVVAEASQTVEFLALELAIQLLGGVFVPVEHNCAADKIIRIADICEADLIITSKEVPADGAQKKYTISEFCKAAGELMPLVDFSFPASDDISELLFSTGTTGKEKGIIITHRNNIALAENVIYAVELQDDNVEMIPSPMNHSHGLRRYYANIYRGASVILISSVMNVLGFFRMMDTYKVNSIDMVPTALTVLLRLSKGKLSEYKDVLRYIQLGSAPLSDSDKNTVCGLLPQTHLYNFYGSTESGCICIYDFNDGKDKPNCIGKPTHNAKILIVNDDRQEIESSFSNTGLLASFGPMNTQGYWKDDEETAKAVKDGVIYSNDEAYLDEDGDIILLGRKGDVINVGGNKVSPDEIEDIAKKHPDIADCGCIGVKDEMRGSQPKLYVKMKYGRSFDSVSVRSFISERAEPYKVPELIEEIDEIPRSFNGKLLRRVLRSYDEKK
ncbi:MAG: acyl--CoA ligase [Clostridia bacterium]|nr:acyl--CoA ligase [Clostridia bacterium]